MSEDDLETPKEENPKTEPIEVIVTKNPEPKEENKDETRYTDLTLSEDDIEEIIKEDDASST